MPKFDLSEVEQAEQAVQSDQAAAKVTAEDINSALAFLDRTRVAKRDVIDRLKPRIKEARSYLTTYRKHDNPVVRRAVWKALISFELARPVGSPAQLSKLIGDMVASGLLEASDLGSIAIYDKKYQVNSDSLFNESDTSEIKDLTAKLVSRVRYGVKASATLDALDLLSAKSEGVCFLYVPAERVQGDAKNWRPGGTISLEAKNGTIRPIDASGRIEAPVRQAIEMGVVLTCASLSDAEPPFLRDGDIERGKKTQLVWHLVVRGIRLAEWLKKAKETEGLISPEEFYLRNSVGTCLIDIGEAWRWEEDEEVLWVPRPIVLVERKVIDGNVTLKVVDMPSYLVDFVSGCLDEYPEGEKFSGLPMRLGAIMRAGYRKTRDQAGKTAKVSN